MVKIHNLRKDGGRIKANKSLHSVTSTTSDLWREKPLIFHRCASSSFWETLAIDSSFHLFVILLVSKLVAMINSDPCHTSEK